MSQLGYTWYPQDWWTSETFKRLKRYPMVRYAIRELFDLMYKEGQPVLMNRDYLFDDFNIVLSDDEYKKLMNFIVITEDGKWWIESIRKRISKAESARENGKKGGRPKLQKNPKNNEISETQKPTEKTQAQNPNNPSYKIKEKEKEKVKEKERETRATFFLKNNFPIRYETDFLMKYKSRINNLEKFTEDFDDKCDIEGLEFTQKILFARLGQFARNWIEFQNKNKPIENQNETCGIPII